MIVTDRQIVKVIYDTKQTGGQRLATHIECRKSGFGFDEARDTFKASGIEFFQIVGFIPVAPDGYITDEVEVTIEETTKPPKKGKKVEE